MSRVLCHCGTDYHYLSHDHTETFRVSKVQNMFRLISGVVAYSEDCNCFRYTIWKHMDNFWKSSNKKGGCVAIIWEV
jgi:hypothetical protein